jgi:acetyl-CoA synthetase
MIQKSELYKPVAAFVRQANIKNPEAEYKKAAKDYLRYWEGAAQELVWTKPWKKVLDDSKPPFYKWFVGAKGNIVLNAIDRHLKNGDRDKMAILWESDSGQHRKYTYTELDKAVCRLANGLKSLGIKKGDRVAIYLQNIPEAAISMLACAKIGAVHGIVYAGFAANSLKEWIELTEPKLLITQDAGFRRGKRYPMKPTADEAVKGLRCVKNILVVHHSKTPMPMVKGRDLYYHDLVDKMEPKCETEILDAEDPLFILYNSGTASKPKGMVHCHGGYMVQVLRTFKWVFDVKPNDVFWSTADPGWITGHSYTIYAPLMAGVTTILFEGVPNYPKPDRIWEIVDRHKVNILYTAPTLLRMLMGEGDKWVRAHSLKSLRILGSVGEPINPAVWNWYYSVVGKKRCPIMDTWWQTETGAHMIVPLPTLPLKPGSATKPFPGIFAEVVDQNGKKVKDGERGLLVITKPWPSMARTFYKMEKYFKETYFDRFPGKYFTLDIAMRDRDGYFWALGRADDVLKIAGHRIGTAEIEGAISKHPAVMEVAVIGKPHKIKGEIAKAFIVLKPGFKASDTLSDEIRKKIRTEMGPVAVTDEIEYIDKLPKNRNGKVMRRVLKAKELGLKLEDVVVFD